MSEIEAPTESSEPEPGFGRRLGWEAIAFGGLAALSVVGIGIADFSASRGLAFWEMMVPVFAAVCVATGWTRARRRGEAGAAIIWKQVLHWVPLLLALYLIYSLQATGRLNREDAGLVALIAFALTTLLAGVHLDWRLAVLGALLGVTAAAAALVEEFFWVLLLPALLVGAVVIFWPRRADPVTT